MSAALEMKAVPRCWIVRKQCAQLKLTFFVSTKPGAVKNRKLLAKRLQVEDQGQNISQNAV